MKESEGTRAAQTGHQRQRKQPRKERDAHRLAHQTEAQRADRASEHLLRVDAPDAHRGKRRAEIDQVDRRHQDNQQGDADQQIQVLTASGLQEVVAFIRIIDIGQRKDVRLENGLRIVLQAFVHPRLVHLNPDVLGGHARLQAEESAEVVAQPVVLLDVVHADKKRIVGKLGVLREVLVDSAHAVSGDILVRHPAVAVPVHIRPHGVPFGEELARHAFRHQHPVGSVHPLGVAFHKLHPHRLREALVDGVWLLHEIGGVVRVGAESHLPPRPGEDASALHPRDVLDHIVDHPSGKDGPEVRRAAVDVRVEHHHPPGVGIAGVEAALVAHFHHDDHEGGESPRHPQQIERRSEPETPQCIKQVSDNRIHTLNN